MIYLKTAAVSLQVVELVRGRILHSTLLPLFLTSTVSASLTLGSPVWSATWSGNSGVNMELSVIQRTAGDDVQSERTGTATIEPFYSFMRISRAQTVRGRIGLLHQQFSSDGGQSTSPSLDVDSRTTIVDSRLWFDAKANATRKTISNEGFFDDSPTSEEQTSTALRWQLGPELQYQPGDGTMLRSKAAIARTQLNGNAGDDSNSIGVEGSLLQAVSRQGHLLTVGGNYQQTVFDGGEEAVLGSFAVGGVVPINSRLATYARFGHDWVSVEDLVNADKEQYAVGVRWQPSRRMELNAEYGERAFGRQPSVSMVLMGRRSQLEFRWSKDLQIKQSVDTSLERLQVGDEASDDEASAGLYPVPSCNDIDVADCAEPTLLANAETVEEGITAIYTHRGRVSTFRASLSRTELNGFGGANSRERNEARISVSRSIVKNVRLTLSGSLSETRTDAENTSGRELQTISTSIVWLSR